MAAPFYSPLSGGDDKSQPTKQKWPTKMENNAAAKSSLLPRLRDHTFFLIVFNSGHQLLSQSSKKRKLKKKDTADKKNFYHQGWSERCRVKVDDAATVCETIASPQPLLSTTAESPPPSPDMTFITSSDYIIFSSPTCESSDEIDWIDFLPQNIALELEVGKTNNIIWDDIISSVVNNHSSSEKNNSYFFSSDNLDPDDEFWTVEENEFQTDSSPTSCHRKYPKRKDDTDRICNEKLHDIAEKLSPRAASSVDELLWKSFKKKNANSNAQIAFPFDNKSLLTSVTRNVSLLSKRYVSLQQHVTKHEINRRFRLAKIKLLEEQLERLLCGDERGNDVGHGVTTITSDSIVSTSTPDHHHCNYDGFSLEDRETVISLERLLTVNLIEFKALATRANNLTKSLCKENSSASYAQLPADIIELDSLLTMNATHKPHNNWICAGKPILYCMRCDCNKAHVCFVGQISEGELWHTVDGHFNDLWRKVEGSRSKKQHSVTYLSNDFGQSSFADHVLRKHLRNASSREAVRSWSGEMIRISIVEAHTKHAKVLLNDLLGSSVSSESIECS